MPDLAARCFKFCGSSTGRITFASISFQNEFNGVTENRNSNVRPVVKRQFKSFSQAEEENGQSRIYLGIHWNFEKTEGIAGTSCSRLRLCACLHTATEIVRKVRSSRVRAAVLTVYQGGAASFRVRLVPAGSFNQRPRAPSPSFQLLVRKPLVLFRCSPATHRQSRRLPHL